MAGPAFDEQQAFADVQAIARVPHPVASPQDDAVRAYLQGRMSALGLAPRVQDALGQRVRVAPGGVVIVQAPVRNLVGVLRGRDPLAPALALMAHYDSVPGSPGAADDALGVASVLGLVKAIEAQGEPARDVLVILTEGEEAGLLGAQAFFDADPAAPHIGFVVNIDTRGGGGRPVMFETNTRAGAAVRRLSAVEHGLTANSLLDFAYHQMPNDTDFSVARAHGVAGFNFAVLGRQFDYHSPSSTPGVLDRGALRLMGDQTLAIGRALAFDPSLPKPAPDLVYADLFGHIFAYPPPIGWALLAGVGALLAIAWIAAPRRERPDLRELLWGAGCGLLILVVAALAVWTARIGMGAPPGWLSYRPLLARFPLFEAAMLASALAALILTAVFVAGRARLAGQWLGLLLGGLMLGVALQIAVPAAAFLVAFPLLVGALAAAITGAGTRQGGLAAALVALLAIAPLAWLGGFFHLLLQGLDAAPVTALIVWLAALLLWPLLVPARRERTTGLGAGGALMILAIGLVLWLRLTPAFDARHPQAVMPVEIEEADGSLWRADLSPLSPWSRGWLGAGAALPFPLVGAPGPMAAAQVGRQPPPTLPLSWGPRPDGALVFSTASGVTGDLALNIVSAKPLQSLSLGGASVPLGPAAAQVRVRRTGDLAPLNLVVRAAPGASVKVSWALYKPGPAPALPSGLMGWDHAGARVIAGSPDLPPHR